MNLFQFRVTGKLHQTRPEALDVITHYVQCPRWIQDTLRSVAENKKGRNGVRLSGNKETAHKMITWLSRYPYTVESDFRLASYPLFSEISIDEDNGLKLLPGDVNFYEVLKHILTRYELDAVTFRKERTARFYAHWVLEGRNETATHKVNRIREMLNLSARGYSSFSLIQRILQATQREFREAGLSLQYKGAPKGYVTDVTVTIRKLKQ